MSRAAAPTAEDFIEGRVGEGGAGEWKPGAERRVLKEINGHQYIVLEHAGENRGSWQFHSATPYTPPGTAPTATATMAVTDPQTGAVTQVAMTKEQAEVDILGLKYLGALQDWESGLGTAKTKADLDTTVEALNQARTKGLFLGPQLQQELARGAQALEAGAVTIAKGVEDIKTAPVERAGIAARTGQALAQTTGTQIDNTLKILGTLGTYPEQVNAVRELYASGALDDDTANQIMTRLQRSLATGVSPEKEFEERGALSRQELAGTQALEREQLQEEGRRRTALQGQQVTAATAITGDEAARQRQLLSSAVTQQGNQAQAVNSFINNYQNTGSPSPIASGRGFMDGLSMVRDIFSSIKDLAQPAPQLGQAQGFIGNLLAGGGAPPGVPAVAGPVAPVGPGVQNAAAALRARQPDYLEDPLLAATAAEDNDTLLEPADVAQIQQLRQTDPRRAVNLTVEAWQRAVRGSGQTTRAGRAANATATP